MKKKILFYGNCQSAILSNMLQTNTQKFNEKYEVLKALDYDLPYIWIPEVGTVANWKINLGTVKDTRKIIKNTEKITEDADIIIFQKIEKKINRPDELTTEYIYEKQSANKQMICLPTLHFSGYLTDQVGRPDHELVIPYIFLWLMEKGLTNKQIFYWLKNESHPNISLLIGQNSEDSIEKIKKRENVEKIEYKNFISILDILLKYKKELLCHNHSRPTAYYFKQIYLKLFNIIDVGAIEEISDEHIKLAGPGFYPYPIDFCWFKESFPDINELNTNNYIKDSYSCKLSESFVDDQIDLLKIAQMGDDQLKSKLSKQLNILNS